MPELDRLVAGLRCRDVLADLSLYIDGELPAARVQQIQEHLRGCDWCERFGGRFSAIVAQFRRELHDAEPLDQGIAFRLNQRLRAVRST